MLAAAITFLALAGEAPDVRFLQEVHEPWPLEGAPANDVRAIAVDASNGVWAATRAGPRHLDPSRRGWRRLLDDARDGPAFAAVASAADSRWNGAVWIGAWNGLYRTRRSGSAGPSLEKVSGVDGIITAIAATMDAIVALGPDALWRGVADERGEEVAFRREPLPSARSVRAALADRAGDLWIATGLGLHQHRMDGAKMTRVLRDESDLVGTDVRGLALDSGGALWVAALGGATVLEGGQHVRDFTPSGGIPSADVCCTALGPRGEMWVGTARGAARFDGKSWSVRASRRWLLDDDVRGIAFGPDGAAWIATAAGVSCIRAELTTLEQKASRYLAACHARHIREPGLTGKCRLGRPGDIASWEPTDDDNDGQYTSMYLAMESYRYAVTKDPGARERAAKAFAALELLQTVTETPGFIARTFVPAAWTRMADPNAPISDREWALVHAGEPRAKRVERRWRPSRDGKWLWKGDTSSDEVTGHFFGYLMYHDLAADEPERARVRVHVRKVMDWILDGGLVLRDIDGTATRWGVWSPEKLNGDPDWWAERGMNSLEVLSFLKASFHMTGDAKYEARYRELVEKHGYAENARGAKTTGPCVRTHIDDELMALAIPALLLHEEDPGLRAAYLDALERWHEAAKGEASPLYDFTWAVYGKKREGLEGALGFLRDAPLDLVCWTVDNSRREDLRIVRRPEAERLQTDRLLPASERGVIRWDGNPYDAVQGEGGEAESDGVYWLLPYWMARLHGLLAGK